MDMHNSHRDAFAETERKIDLAFGLALLLSALWWALILIAAVGTGIYLAWKNWG